MHLFIFSIKKMYYLHKTTSAVSCVKPNASQWEATLRDDVGFATVYRRIYRRKFLTLSNQTSRYIRECIRITYYIAQGMRDYSNDYKALLMNTDNIHVCCLEKKESIATLHLKKNPILSGTM